MGKTMGEALADANAAGAFGPVEAATTAAKFIGDRGGEPALELRLRCLAWDGTGRATGVN